MRQRLNALVLAGKKVATAGLWEHDYVSEGEEIDVVGERQALLDDDDAVIAIVEITRVETHRFDDVPWEFADAEGEGFTSIEHWRSGHLGFYERTGVSVNPDSLVVCCWFRVLERRQPASG